MAELSYRPWGSLPWILERVPESAWALMGSLAPEERCLATWEVLLRQRALKSVKLFEVVDRPSRFYSAAEDARGHMRQRFLELGGVERDLLKCDLFMRPSELVAHVRECVDLAQGNVVIDMSALPKRFFFPAIKIALGSSSTKNIVVTYTLPESYGEGALAEDPQPWSNLPLFGPDYPPRAIEDVIISVGFQALRLPPLGDQQYQAARFQLLVPLPGMSPESHRIWEFLHSFRRDRGQEADIKWVDWKDVPEVFSVLRAHNSDGGRGAILAPYGPKPISLAMLLYARLTNAGVYYTQPTAYNPQYSIGIRSADVFPETLAYPLRLGGKDLYTL